MPVSIEMSVSDNLDAEEEDIPDAALVQQWAEKACLCDDQVITSVQIVSKELSR